MKSNSTWRVAKGQLEEILERTQSKFSKNIKVVGTVTQALRDLPIIPRDIDLLLPSCMAPMEFETQVLEPLGYEDIGNYCWAREEKGKSFIDLSQVNMESDFNGLAAYPSASFGWEFPSASWESVRCGSQKVLIPSIELSLLLKLKSLADKIFLCTHASEVEASFWKPLLVNDIRCFSVEIWEFEKKYRFEELWSLLRHFSGPPDIVGTQLLKAHNFALAALAQNQRKTPAAFSLLAQIINRIFSIDKCSEPVEATNQWVSDAVNVKVNHSTGAISLEAPSAKAIEDWLPPIPFFVDVQLNSSCNMTCAHCDYHMTGHSLSLDLFEQKLVDLSDAGVLQANLGEASEALLYPNLEAAIKLCSKHGITPNLSTNLSMDLGDSLQAAILRSCGTVAVSVDGFHLPGIEGKTSTHKIFKRLGNLVNSGQRVVLNTVYEPGDLSSVRAAISVARNFGCSDICVIRRFFSGATTYQRLPLSDLAELADLLTSGIGEFGVGFHSCDPVVHLFSQTPLPPASRPLAQITQARHSVFLDSHGRYCPSSFSADGDRLSIPIREAWISPEFAEFRRSTSQGMKLID